MRVIFSARATLYDVRDPNFAWGHSTPIIVTDPLVLKAHGNLKCEECLVPYLKDGSDMEAAISELLSEGYLQYQFLDEGESQYSAITEYISSRPLTSKELEVLKEYTHGQWLDGVGSGFQQEYADQTGYWPEVDLYEELLVEISG